MWCNCFIYSRWTEDVAISFGDFGGLHPPIACGSDFMDNVPGSQTPKLLIQVTRLTCGRCLLRWCSDHWVNGGVGIPLFLKARSEIAREAASSAASAPHSKRYPAVLWQWTAKALHLPADQESKMLLALHARSDFQPPLPSGYDGYVISFSCGKAKPRDLTPDICISALD